MATRSSVAIASATPSAMRSHEDAAANLSTLWETLRSYSDNAPPTDDMTAIAICHLRPAQENALHEERKFR